MDHNRYRQTVAKKTKFGQVCNCTKKELEPFESELMPQYPEGRTTMPKKCSVLAADHAEQA